MKTIKRSFIAERAKDGSVVLATESPVPQDGLILKADNWDLSRGEKVPFKMFFNHNSWSDPPIGLWDNMRVKGKKLMGAPVFASEEDPGRAGLIERLWDAGFMDDVSVSFSVDLEGAELKKVGEREFTIPTKQTLHEVSIVGIGADQKAGKGRQFNEVLTRAFEAGDITEEERAELEVEIVEDSSTCAECDNDEGRATINVQGLCTSCGSIPKARFLTVMLTLPTPYGGVEVPFVSESQDEPPPPDPEEGERKIDLTVECIDNLTTEVRDLKSLLGDMKERMDRLSKDPDQGTVPDPGEIEIEIEDEQPTGERETEIDLDDVERIVEKAASKMNIDVKAIVEKRVGHHLGRLPE